jgi:hypothetical protein
LLLAMNAAAATCPLIVCARVVLRADGVGGEDGQREGVGGAKQERRRAGGPGVRAPVDGPVGRARRGGAPWGEGPDVASPRRRRGSPALARLAPRAEHTSAPSLSTPFSHAGVPSRAGRRGDGSAAAWVVAMREGNPRLWRPLGSADAPAHSALQVCPALRAGAGAARAPTPSGRPGSGARCRWRSRHPLPTRCWRAPRDWATRSGPT